jgi:DNA-binding IclR family transcriptional regulator
VTPGLAGVAAPVLDHNAHPVAGLALTFAADDRSDRLAEEVRRAAAVLTRRLGGPAESVPER